MSVNPLQLPTLSNNNSALSFFLQEGKPIVIFGAGNVGRKIGNFLISKGHRVIAFADNNEKLWSSELLGLPVRARKDFSKDELNDAVWIVAIWSPGHSFRDTKQQLKSYGAREVFHAAALMQLYPKELLPHYHFQTPEFYLSHSNELQQVYELLADDESKKQLVAHINCRINLDFGGLPDPDTENQYFPSGIVSLTDKEVFMDAGAYNGDTLLEFSNRTGNKFSKYLALEPDPMNYQDLKKVASSFESGKVEVFPYAVGSENTVLKFDATGGTGASISEKGTVEVECKRADDIFFNYKPTYLKFDIEGAELSALKGCKKIISTYRPKLAVCLYHLPEDLWQICLYLQDNFPFYSFFVRTHGYDGFDLVLYAIPNK